MAGTLPPGPARPLNEIKESWELKEEDDLILHIQNIEPGIADDDGGEGDVELEHVGECTVDQPNQ